MEASDIQGAEFSAVRRAYDAVAESYGRLLPDLGVEAPIDRAMIGAFAEYLAALPGRRVLDAGCGTGRLIPALTRLGLRATGVDLSPAMIAVARRMNPETTFTVADLATLPFADGEFGGAVAWYSLIHTSDDELPRVVGELSRVVRPGGYVLTGFQSGSGVRRIERAYGHDIELTAFLRTPVRMQEALANAGLEPVAMCERDPVSERHPQAFVMARKRAQ